MNSTTKKIIALALLLVIALLVIRYSLVSSIHREEKQEKDDEENDNPVGVVDINNKKSNQEGTSCKRPSYYTPSSSFKMQSSSSSSCTKMYSSICCVDNGEKDSFVGPENVYGFNIYNRSCMYENVVYENFKFVVYLHPSELSKSETFQNKFGSSLMKKSLGTTAIDEETLKVIASEILPPVSLSSRPFDLPHNHRKRVIVKNKMRESHQWRPIVRIGPIPCHYFASAEKSSTNTQGFFPEKNTVLAYYSPIVAPWNYAHTLLCDLFGVFWAAYDLFNQNEELVPKNMQIVAFGKHYASDFPLPNKNKAFQMLSTKPPCYEGGLKNGVVYGKLIAGMGTKSWSWVTPEYKANGSPTIWYDFRKHILKTVGILKSNGEHRQVEIDHRKKLSGSTKKTLHVSICHKKDKRGVVNYEETLQYLQDAAKDGYFGSDIDINFALESSVGKSPDAQVQLMLDADIYICNEGTLSTPLFLMRPGKSYVSLPLVYHTPHLHQRRMPKPSEWWRVPDPLRPDPRKNVGGNIDWFPQAIPWVKTFWYDYIPLNETKIQEPLKGLRNYMPDMNIVIQKHRILPLVKKAVDFVVKRRDVVKTGQHLLDSLSFDDVPEELLTDRPNYSITADLCRQMLQAAPNMTKSFNTARCLFGMSWLCEFWANTEFKWRFLHGKWSYHFCGGKASSVDYLKLDDPRMKRPLKEFLFFTKDELLGMYNDTDFGKLKEKAGEEETKFFLE